MFVRRLLVSAVLACLAACTTTANSPVNKNPDLKQSTSIGNTKALDYQMIPKRSEQPHSVTVSNHNALDTALCLKQRLGSDFKMPEEFIGHTVYTDHNHSVGLINPFTKTEGITMDVVAQGANSEIRLYSNGNLLSRAWQQLPNKCGQGKTTVITQNSAKSVAASKTVSSKANTSNTANRIDFVAKSKTEPSLWVDNTSSAQSMSKPAVVTTMASNTPITVTPPTIVATEAVNTPTSIASTNTADQGWLTEEDMNIIAPATAAVVTPLMAKAAYDNVKQPSNNGQSLVATNTNAVKANNVAPVRPVVKATANSTSSAAKTAASPTASSKTTPLNSKKAATSSSNKASSTKTANNTQQAANKTKTQEKENTRNSKSSTKNKNAASTKANNSAAAANKDSKTKARNTSNLTTKNEAANNKNSKNKAKGEVTNSKNSKVKTKAETANNKNSKTTNKQDKAATQKANQTSKSSKKETTGVKNDKTKTKVQEGNNKTKTTANKEKTSNKKAENSKKPANTNKSKPKA